MAMIREVDYDTDVINRSGQAPREDWALSHIGSCRAKAEAGHRNEAHEADRDSGQILVEGELDRRYIMGGRKSLL